MARSSVLILGGTQEARALADRIARTMGDRVRVVSSLAGRTRDPILPEGEVRSGGFGGVAGLADYLRRENIAALIDATHPFAATISAHAAEAASSCGVKRLILARPPWRQRRGDRWILVDNARAAARLAARRGRRLFLALGGLDIASLAELRGRFLLSRRIDDATPLRGAHRVVLDRGPFDRRSEIDLMRRHRIDVVLTKASGGDATRAKLDAARVLGLPVVMIRRPRRVEGRSVETVDAAIDWLAAQLDSASSASTDAASTMRRANVRVKPARASTASSRSRSASASRR